MAPREMASCKIASCKIASWEMASCKIASWEVASLHHGKLHHCTMRDGSMEDGIVGDCTMGDGSDQLAVSNTTRQVTLPLLTKEDVLHQNLLDLLCVACPRCAGLDTPSKLVAQHGHPTQTLLRFRCKTFFLSMASWGVMSCSVLHVCTVLAESLGVCSPGACIPAGLVHAFLVPRFSGLCSLLTSIIADAVLV